MAAPTTAQLPAEVYGTLSGMIDANAMPRIFGAFGYATDQRAQSVHLLLQSIGGAIGEGVCLYNFFRALPIDLTLYNCGSVSSIAVIAYLGAKTRKVSAHASFMIHRTQTTAQSADTNTIKAFAASAILFDQTIESILRKHIDMPKEKWDHFDHNDLWFSAKEAVEYGIATEIGEFTPPLGAKIYNF